MSLGIPLALPDELVDALVDQIAVRVARELRRDQPAEQRYYRVEEAAEYLRCPKSRIYDLRALGHLNPMPGSAKPLVFSRDELERYLHSA